MSIENTENRLQAERLIADFAKTVGIEGMAFDEDGQCNLAFDDQPVAIAFDADTGYISLGAPVMEIPSSPSKDFYSWGLEANFASFTGGIGCLALDRAAGNVVWLDRRSLKHLTQSDFETWLSASLERVEFLVRQLPELSNSSVLAESSQDKTTVDLGDVVFRV